MYNGIMNNMSNLFLLSNAVSRSISPENLNGAKARAPCASWRTALPSMPPGPGQELEGARILSLRIAAGETLEIAGIEALAPSSTFG